MSPETERAGALFEQAILDAPAIQYGQHYIGSKLTELLGESDAEAASWLATLAIRNVPARPALRDRAAMSREDYAYTLDVVRGFYAGKQMPILVEEASDSQGAGGENMRTTLNSFALDRYGRYKDSYVFGLLASKDIVDCTKFNSPRTMMGAEIAQHLAKKIEDGEDVFANINLGKRSELANFFLAGVLDSMAMNPEEYHAENALKLKQRLYGEGSNRQMTVLARLVALANDITTKNNAELTKPSQYTNRKALLPTASILDLRSSAGEALVRVFGLVLIDGDHKKDIKAWSRIFGTLAA